jgi:hypothetical protein
MSPPGLRERQKNYCGASPLNTQPLHSPTNSAEDPILGVKFSSKESAVMVEVPAAAIDLNDDRQIQGRVFDLPRYGILARSVFGETYDSVHVVEMDETRKKQ